MALRSYRIHHINPIASVKIYTLTIFTLTFFVGILDFFSQLYLFMTSAEAGISLLTFLGAALIQEIIGIASATVVGALIGILAIIVYNWWAKRLGGFVIELDDEINK